MHNWRNCQINSHYYNNNYCGLLSVKMSRLINNSVSRLIICAAFSIHFFASVLLY